MEVRENSELQEDFYQKFNKKETIDIAGTLLKFADISPAQDVEPIPILLAPGWAGDKAMFKDVLYSFYKKNYRVLFLSHPTHVKTSKNKKDVLRIENRKAQEILTVIEKSGVDFVDAVFYSEGGINGILAAIKNPEKFRNIILVDPGGFMKEDKVSRLIYRFVMEIIQLVKDSIFIPENRKKLLRVEKEVLTYVTKNPIRTLKEAEEIATEDVMEMLKILHKKGIGISIIHSASDKVFPIKKIRKNVDSEMVDYFYPTKGSHFELLVEPQRYVDLIINAINVEQRKHGELSDID